jgi:phosphoribosyl 1,2-cyclic phosphodiesterase
MEDAIDFGTLAAVKKMVLFHHDPINSDTQLEKMFRDCTRNKKSSFEVSLARESEVFYL